MKPAAFEYCRADTIDDALELLDEFGADAVVLAGGQSLSAMLNMRLVRPRAVIDVNRIGELGGVARGDGWIRTGAMLRQADALADRSLMADLPLLAEAMPEIGHFQTRSRGTLGGSAAHADPSAEIPLILVALGGEVLLRSRTACRTATAREFFLGPLTTARRGDELVTALRWPARRPGGGHAFAEIAQRRGDFAIAACAAVVEIGPDGALEAASLGVGGVEDRPRRIDAGGWRGAAPAPETAAAIADAAASEVDPMEDGQADAAYRRQLVRVLGARVLKRAFARARAATARDEA